MSLDGQLLPTPLSESLALFFFSTDGVGACALITAVYFNGNKAQIKIAVASRKPTKGWFCINGV